MKNDNFYNVMMCDLCGEVEALNEEHDGCDLSFNYNLVEHFHENISVADNICIYSFRIQYMALLKLGVFEWLDQKKVKILVRSPDGIARNDAKKLHMLSQQNSNLEVRHTDDEMNHLKILLPEITVF